MICRFDPKKICKSWVFNKADQIILIAYSVLIFLLFLSRNCTDIGDNGQKIKYSSSRVENQNHELRKRVEELESQLVEKVTKEKRQIDLLMAKFHDGMASQTEKEQLRRLFVSKQQAQNERLINEQQRRIETLQAKVQPDTVTAGKVAGGGSLAEMEALRKELADFKSLVYRLNVAAEDKDQALVIAKVSNSFYSFWSC